MCLEDKQYELVKLMNGMTSFKSRCIASFSVMTSHMGLLHSTRCISHNQQVQMTARYFESTSMLTKLGHRPGQAQSLRRMPYMAPSLPDIHSREARGVEVVVAMPQGGANCTCTSMAHAGSSPTLWSSGFLLCRHSNKGTEHRVCLTTFYWPNCFKLYRLQA